MAARTLTVGTVQVTAHCDVTGDFPAPLAEAFPQVPVAAWAPWRSRHPGAFGGPGRWRLRDWCFVVRSRDLVVLVDTGVGGPGVPGAGWIGTPGRLPAELADAGVEPDEIDLVVLTHLHLDHVGWNLAWDGDRPRPWFPRARYLVQRADWDLFAARPAETRVAFDRCVAPLQALGVAELLDGDRALDAQLRLVHTPGHTPGSQSLLVRSGDDAVLLWGDVANHPAQVGEPDWCPAADVDPDRARATRRRLLDQLEAEGMWLAPAHFPEPFGTVTRVDGARRWAGRAATG
jgi:glyoxylase-like metal-dependent hydrolase (beta-lactamase superfamily II)